MKKIININLSGRVIPIEDAAYESLQRYIESLRRYFAHEEGRDEIINDIESRIAELMNDKVRKGAAAVTEADMNEIISSMGRVEDFEAADAAETTTATGDSGFAADPNFVRTGATGKKGRLYRDASDKLVGGVCSGIANYMNVDPAIVRLLFAIVTFGGFGAGIFIYILLWIILPVRDLETYVGKRLFRNPDDRILGGVASGLAAYFHKPVKWIRLIFAAPLLLNIFFSLLGNLASWDGDLNPVDFAFGSFTGMFIIVYIVLWIVLPEARSSFEKMEMRGETVDVNRIRENVRTKAQAWSEEVRTTAQQFGERARTFTSSRGPAFAAEVSQTARPVANGIGHAIGVLFKAFFLFVAGSMAFALFVMVLVFTMGGVAQPFRDFLISGFWQNLSLWGVLIFFLAVPLIALITWIIRRVMKVRSQNRYLGWTFGGLWTLGWISLFLFIATMGRDWRHGNIVRQEVALVQPRNAMVVRVDEPRVEYSGTFGFIDDDNDNDNWDLTEDSIRVGRIKIELDKSPDTLYHVTVLKHSRGSNRNEAAQKAQRITYTASSLDSVLVLGSGYGISKEQKFRGQMLKVEILIPVGKKIRFDQSVADKLGDVRLTDGRNYRYRDFDFEWNSGDYFEWTPNTYYVMTENGTPVREGSEFTTTTPAITDTVTAPSGTYEYRRQQLTEEERERLRREIEEDRRRTEEKQERLRRLEEERTSFRQPGIEKALKGNKPAGRLDAVGFPFPATGLII